MAQVAGDNQDITGGEAHIEGLEAYIKEMTPPRVSLPTMTFDRRLVLHRGGREIHLLFLGRAHTAGDVVAYIPSERVLKEGGYEGGGAMIYYDVPGPFRRGLEEKIVRAVKDLLGKSFVAPFDPSRTGGSLPLSPQQ